MKSSSPTTDLGRQMTLSGVKTDGKIGKSRPQRDPAVTEEMQTYFSKLKELVPFIPKNRKVTRLEIIQNVIDYICDLQFALEAHPAARTAAAAAVVSSPTSVSPSRQPLGVIAAPNALPNTCGAQEVSHLDKTSPSHLDDMSSRPVSC